MPSDLSDRPDVLGRDPTVIRASLPDSGFAKWVDVEAIERIQLTEVWRLCGRLRDGFSDYLIGRLTLGKVKIFGGRRGR